MKAVTIFQTELPTAQEISNKLNAYDLKGVDEEGNPRRPLTCYPCPEKSIAVFGFTAKNPVVITEQGYCLSFETQSKDIPAKVINTLLQQETDAIYAANGAEHYIDKKTIYELKENILAKLTPRYVATSSYMKAYYHTQSGQLIIDSGKQDSAQMCVALLRRLLGSIKTTTLHVDDLTNGLTANVKHSLELDLGLGFEGFSFGEGLTLLRKVKGEKDSKIVYSGEYDEYSLLDHLQQGYKVTKVELMRDGLTFTLNEGLQISGIKLAAGIETEIMQDVKAQYGESDRDEAEQMKRDAKFLEEQTQVELLVGISKDLVTYFSNTDKSTDESDTNK